MGKKKAVNPYAFTAVGFKLHDEFLVTRTSESLPHNTSWDATDFGSEFRNLEHYYLQSEFEGLLPREALRIALTNLLALSFARRNFDPRLIVNTRVAKELRDFDNGKHPDASYVQLVQRRKEIEAKRDDAKAMDEASCIFHDNVARAVMATGAEILRISMESCPTNATMHPIYQAEGRFLGPVFVNPGTSFCLVTQWLGNVFAMAQGFDSEDFRVYSSERDEDYTNPLAYVYDSFVDFVKQLPVFAAVAAHRDA